MPDKHFAFSSVFSGSSQMLEIWALHILTTAVFIHKHAFFRSEAGFLGC